MNKIILLVILISPVQYTQLTNAHFETQFVFSDNLYADTLHLGYDAFATDGLDIELGEQIVPQVPQGYFGVRFQLPSDTSLYTIKDLRFGCGQPFFYEYLFDLSYGGTANINIDWEWEFELMAVHIFDGINHQYITTLESYFDPSEYLISPGMEKIILGIQYNGPLSWPEYTVTSPNGSETLLGGEYFTVTWNSNGIIPPFKLEYTKDGGNNWELVSDSLWNPNNSYDWLVPYVLSDSCLIRIGEYPCAYDQSNNYFTISSPVGIENQTEIPKEFSLHQNYPNPFNPSTKIKYSIPHSSQVKIGVFDVLGNEIETLVNDGKQTGTYEMTWYAERLPSGVYFYKLQAGSFVETKKMILMK